MPLPFARGITVTRLRGTRVDDGYGGERIDWSDPDRLTIKGCAIAPLVEDEQLDRGREGVVHAWTLYAPWSDITAWDRIDTPQGVFNVDGDPGLWQSPYTGAKPGMTVRLVRVEG